MTVSGPNLIGASLLALAISGAPAFAQAADSPAVETNEIIVTASKRETRLQDTPIAITALTGETLEAMGAAGMDDFFRSVPGLVVQEGETAGGRGRISVRGIRSQGEATLALYYGETPIIGSSGTSSDPGGRTGDLALFDVRQIEVLRGPQGTLYGSSSMGGTIRILFNEPSTSGFAGSARGEASFTDGGGFNHSLQAMLNLPLGETLALRAIASRSETEGHIDQVALGFKNTNDSDQTSIRAALKWTPRSDFSYTLTALRQKSGLDDAAFYNTTLGRFDMNAPTMLSYDEGFTLVSGEGRLDLGFAELVSATAWQRTTTDRTVDGTSTVLASIAAPTTSCRIHFGLIAPASCTTDQIAEYVDYARTRTPALFYAEMDNRVFTQELRLTSPSTGRFLWTVGGYFETREDSVDSYVVLADATSGRLVKPIDVTSYRYINTDTTQYALFGEGTLEIMPGLKLTGGLRYYSYEKQIAGEVVMPGGPSYQGPSPYTQTTTTEQGAIGKASVSYEASDDVLFYATASQGFRPGGTNNTPNIPAELIPYQSDSLWNYEVGVKTSWFDKRFDINVAGYRIDWDNIQVSTRTADNVFVFITNAGAARVYGAELEVAVRPVEGLSLSGSLNYTDAYLTADQVNSNSLPSASIGRDGDKIPYAPKWSGSAAAEYQWPISTSTSGLVRIDYSYTGKYSNTFRPTLASYREIGDYHLVSGRVGLRMDNWNVSLFARNLFNVHAATFTDGVNRNVAVRPRTLGLNLGFEF
jgi:iron complex outermembrane receptor protein